MVLVLALLVPFKGVAQGADEDLKVMKERLYDIALSYASDDHDIGMLLSSFDWRTGFFSDIDYQDQTAKQWQPGYHWFRLTKLALEYVDTHSPNWHDPKIKDCVIKATRSWIERPSIAKNGWWNLIGVPMEMARVFILMENEVGSALIHSALPLLNYAVKPDYYDYHGPATGENLLWETFNHISSCVLVGDLEGLRRAVDASSGTISITDEEGIQADYSFYQHGKQSYAFGYGRSFSLTAAQIIYTLKGTSFQLPPEKEKVLSHYILDGEQWCSYRQMLEYTAMGREISRPVDKTIDLLRASRLMRHVDVSRKEEYDDFIAQLEGRPRERSLEGNRYFDRIQLLVHQGKDYFFSVKNATYPIRYTESGNNENLKGCYLGDGTQFIVRKGDEYDGIFPVWNWRRLPGSIIEQSPETLALHDFGKGAEGPVTFAAGWSDGSTGFFSIQTDREGIRANRSWFCVNGKIVHLLSNLSFDKKYDVCQTVNQTDCRSVVYVNNLKMAVDSVVMPVKSVWQDSIGYYFPNEARMTIIKKKQSGSWFELNHAYSNERITKEVFTLFENFGKKGNAGSSCYIICPNVSSADDLAKICSDIEIVSNTADSHCVHVRSTDTYYLTDFGKDHPSMLVWTGSRPVE